MDAIDSQIECIFNVTEAQFAQVLVYSHDCFPQFLLTRSCLWFAARHRIKMSQFATVSALFLMGGTTRHPTIMWIDATTILAYPIVQSQLIT